MWTPVRSSTLERGEHDKKLATGVGVVLLIFGVIFGLQGLGVLGGSAMSGKTVWAVLGPLIALAGLGLIVGGRRGRNRAGTP